MQIETRRIYRESKLVGTPVVNTDGEHLGRIEDLVIDVESNRMMYAILSYGGYLWFDRKCLAVPWDEMSLSFDEERKHFVLDVDKERLRAVDGFSPHQHPDFSRAEKRRETDDQFRGIRKERQPATETPAREPRGFTAAPTAAPASRARESALERGKEVEHTGAVERPREEAAERNLGESRRFSDTTGGY